MIYGASVIVNSMQTNDIEIQKAQNMKKKNSWKKINDIADCTFE